MNLRRAPVVGFKRHLRVDTASDEVVYLTSERGTFALTGSHLSRLAPRLDGRHDLAELRDAVPDMPSDQLGRLLGQLASENLVGFRSEPLPPGADTITDAYWDLAEMDTESVHDTLATASVEVVSLTAVDCGSVPDACEAAGLSVVTGMEPATVSIVLCDDYLDPALEEINDRRLGDGRPWLLAKPSGADLWLGPIFRPGSGPCWHCLATRLQGHRRGRECLQRSMAAPVRPPQASLWITRRLGVQMAVLETVKWLAGACDDTQDTVWTLNTITLASGRHRITRRPQCSACGDPGIIADRVRRPVKTGSRRKQRAEGNGHRALGLEEVWERYRHLVDPITGLVDQLQRNRRSPSFLHSYVSGPNRACVGQTLSEIREGLRQQSGGKGRTDLEARVGAMCEAVERYCGSRHGDEPTVRDTFRGLGAQAVHPDSCQLVHERQFRDRASWNASHAPNQRVPEPFDDNAVIDWTPVWSLTAGVHRLLPTGLLYYHASTAGALPSLLPTSNGNAAGSSIEDAILQGFLELVERDAVALWWYNRTRHPAVLLDSFDDAWIDDLTRRYAELDRTLWVLDVSSDLGIPVMAAISRRVDKPAQDIMLGFGAHFDPRVAVVRALTELGQVLPAVVNARVDGTGYAGAGPPLRDWWLHATTENQPYLLPKTDYSPLSLDDYAYTPRADLGDDIEHIRGLAHQKDLDVLVLDQTRPDIEMPVVKVIVPGLRHFWARFAPGRLYDVPVRLGRREIPTAYEHLNPIPIFM